MPHDISEQILNLEALSGDLEPSSEQRSQLIQAVADYVETFLKDLPSALASSESPDKAKGLLDSPIGEDPMDIQLALGLLRQHLDSQGQNLPSGKFMGFIPGTPLYHSALGDYMAAATNRYSGHFFGSPGAVRMENMLLRWMADLMGYPQSAGGNLTSGGSIAHLTAVVTAREAFGLKAKDFERTVIYLSDQTHHALTKSLRVAGLGECVQRLIPTDTNHRMIPEALESTIISDFRLGLVPWMVVATAGTTNTGSVDPLEPIAAIAHDHRLWFHVDAAYGGFFALCTPGKHILKGIERSDSLILDPHKGLFIPYGTGAVLVRDVQKLHAAFGSRGHYLQDAQQSPEELSPSDLSPELSRHFRGLRLWLPLKLLGIRPFAHALEEKLLLAQYFYQQLQTMEGFEVGSPPDLSIVPFRYLPKTGDANAFNQRLLEAIQQDGRVFLSSTMLKDRFVIRAAILGFRTHLKTIQLTLEILQEKVQQLLLEA